MTSEKINSENLNLENMSSAIIIGLRNVFAKDPSQVVYVDRDARAWTVAEILAKIRSYSAQIQASFDPAEKEMVPLFPLGADLICVLIAAFYCEKTIVFIDPRLGAWRFFRLCWGLEKVVIASKANRLGQFLIRVLFPRSRTLQLLSAGTVSDNSLVSLGGAASHSLENKNLLVSFTTGTTTGIKKVIRLHQHFIKSAQIFSRNIIALKEDRHLIGYTLSAIRNFIDMGLALELPRKCPDIARFLETERVSRISGPPSLIYKSIVSLAQKNKINTVVENIILGGAPIQKWLLVMIQKYFPNAKVQIIYGCTEAEPISNTTAEEVLRLIESGTMGSKIYGHYVGRPVDEIKYELISVGGTPRADGVELYHLKIFGPQVIHELGHETTDVVRIVGGQGLTLVGRSKFLLKNSRGEVFGAYELECYLEEHFLWIKKIAVIQRNEKLMLFVEAHPKDLLVRLPQIDWMDFKKTASIYLRGLKFEHVSIYRRKKLPYDRRQGWKVQYLRL